jgi:hypothetical protein
VHRRDNKHLQPGFRLASRTLCAWTPATERRDPRRERLALAALLSRLVLTAALLTALTRLLLAGLLLATLVGIVWLVHVLLLLPPEYTKRLGAIGVPRATLGLIVAAARYVK